MNDPNFRDQLKCQSCGSVFYGSCFQDSYQEMRRALMRAEHELIQTKKKYAVIELRLKKYLLEDANK